MKKIFFFFTILLLPFFALAVVDSGDFPSGGDSSLWTIQNPINVDTIEQLTERIFRLIVYMGTPLLVMAIMWVGFTFVTAKGNEGKLKTAKENLMWTLIGAAVILGAWAIAEALKNTVEQIGGNTSFHYERLLYYNV